VQNYHSKCQFTTCMNVGYTIPISNHLIKAKFFSFWDWNCIANVHARFSCQYKNNLTINMHGYLTSFKKLITIANMSRFHIALRHPLIKIYRNCCYRCKIWQYIQIHYLLDHGKKHFSHMKKTRRKLNKKALL
jgi:hypothetical protein